MKATAEKLVSQLLGEEGPLDQDLPTRPPVVSPNNHVSGDASDEDDEDDFEDDAEEKMEEFLADLLSEAGYSVGTFSEYGVLTRNRGIIARGELGRFQIEIIEDSH